jgi:hypothetical protein
MDPGPISNDREAVERIDRLVQERVLGNRVARVNIWTRQAPPVPSV